MGLLDRDIIQCHVLGPGTYLNDEFHGWKLARDGDGDSTV